MGASFADTRTDFPRLIKDIPTPLMVLDHGLCFIAANDCYLEMTRRTEAALLGNFVFNAFPEAEDRVAVMREAFKGALAGNITSLERYVFAIKGNDGISVDSW